MTALAPKVTHISGKRWFQYGEGYLQTAFEMMELPYTGTRGLREDLNITYSVADVSRKSDL